MLQEDDNATVVNVCHMGAIFLPRFYFWGPAHFGGVKITIFHTIFQWQLNHSTKGRHTDNQKQQRSSSITQHYSMSPPNLVEGGQITTENDFLIYVLVAG